MADHQDPVEDFKYNFSSGNNTPIVANENYGINWGSNPLTPIDFDCDDSIDTSTSIISNLDYYNPSDPNIKDHNDWATIRENINMATYNNKTGQELLPSAVKVLPLAETPQKMPETKPVNVPDCPAHPHPNTY